MTTQARNGQEDQEARRSEAEGEASDTAFHNIHLSVGTAFALSAFTKESYIHASH